VSEECESAVRKEREPVVWKEPTIDERRSSDKGRSSDKAGTANKPTTEPAKSTSMRYRKTTTAAHSTTESTTTKTTAAVHSTTKSTATKTTSAVHSTTTKSTTTKSSLRRSRYQGGPDHSRCRESGEFLVDHGAVLLLARSPLRLLNELLNEQKLTIPGRDYLL
jgi:cobalamin biosynthesis Mg chelatase CobN